LGLQANGSSPSIGVGGYSEGVGDDVNKVIWSLLAAEPELTVADAVRQYSRYHFGSEHEDTMADVIFGLEQNWAGAIGADASVSTVRGTLAAAQLMEAYSAVSGANTGNWRLEMLLYRAYFDAAVQARYQFEQSQQRAAYDVIVIY